MALIKCPECGNDISDTAKNCVHCGVKIKKNNSVNIKYIIIVAAIIIIGICAFLFSSGDDPFLELDIYIDSKEAQEMFGSPDAEEYRDYERNKYVDIYYNHKFCGYKGQLEISYGSDTYKEIGTSAWRYYFKDGSTYDEQEKCIKKLQDYMTEKFGESTDADYSYSVGVWEDSHGNQYVLRVHSNSVVIEKWAW